MTDSATWVAGWRLDDGTYIDLVTPEQFRWFPAGTVFTSIFGEARVKGRDEIDRDTRLGYMAYGVPCPRGDTSGTVHADD
jgi:hypothetical protein